jgi:hypothetical protein
MQMQSQRYAMPNKEVQRSDQLSDVSAQAEDANLSVNNLVYEQPQALSLAVSRSTSRLFFQRSAYNPGETAIIDFNSGTDFIDPDNSYITFNFLPVASADTVNCGFGSGSAMNLIRQVTLRSRSGVELDRVERANVWSLYDTIYRNPPSWFTTVGAALEGWGGNTVTTSAGAYTRAGTSGGNPGYRFILPLRRFAPFFRPMKGCQKIPPQLMSGLHMEIIWEQPQMALLQGSGTPGTLTSYAISNLSLMVDAIAMTDDVQKTINQESADHGLEYAYPRVYTAPEATGGALTLSSQVRKAVSQANSAFAVSLDSARYTNFAVDSFAAIQWNVTRWQWRLGALYFPLQPLDVGISDGIESYKQVLEVFDKNKLVFQPPNVTLAAFQGNATIDTVNFSYSQGVMAVELEKDQELDCSGLPVNNSRVLELNATFSGGLATQEVLIFLDYNSVSRSYVDNTAVSI